MTERSRNSITVLKYTALLCSALVDQYIRESTRMAEKTLESRPNAEKTKERLEMLKLGITKVSFIFETGRKYHKLSLIHI